MRNRVISNGSAYSAHSHIQPTSAQAKIGITNLSRLCITTDITKGSHALKMLLHFHVYNICKQKACKVFLCFIGKLFILYKTYCKTAKIYV